MTTQEFPPFTEFHGGISVRNGFFSILQRCLRTRIWAIIGVKNKSAAASIFGGRFKKVSMSGGY